MILVHAPSSEIPFLTGGYGVNRKIIAYNFFEIVGPPGDPANVTGMTPEAALTQIKTLGEQGNAIWVSRNDGSGTFSKEQSLWKAAGINWTQISTETSWYKSTGQTMTPTLQVANELGGYTLVDTAIYLQNYNNGNIQLKVVVYPQQELLNVYSAIADNPLNSNLTGTNFNAEMTFIQWLVSTNGQNAISNFGNPAPGQSLFNPFVSLATTGSNATLLSWIQSYAYLANVNGTIVASATGTECPAAYRYNATSLYANSYDTVANTNIGASLSQLQYMVSGENQQMLLSYGTSTLGQPTFSPRSPTAATGSKARALLTA